jgi:hypothetical protein
VGKYILKIVRIKAFNRTIYWDNIRALLDNRKINRRWIRQKYDGKFTQGSSINIYYALLEKNQSRSRRPFKILFINQ